MKTVYIQGKSKAALNRELKAGKELIAYEFNMFTGDQQYNFAGLPDGTIVKVFQKYANGSPYAEAYGTKKGNKIL